MKDVLNKEFKFDRAPLKYLVSTPITDGPHETPFFIERDDGVPFLSVDAIVNGELNITRDRLISQKDAKEYGRKCQPRKGDLLIGKAASTGKIAQVKEDTYFSIWSPLAMVRANDLIDTTYLEFYLKSVLGQDQIDLFSNVNTQKNVGMEDLNRIQVLLPPLEDQIKIGLYLDRMNKQIDCTILKVQSQIEELQKYKDNLVTELTTKYGSSPKEKLKYLVSNMKTGPFGSDLKAEDIVTSGIPVFNQRVVLDDSLESIDSYVSQKKYDTLRTCSVHKGDMLITTRGTIGKVMYVEKEITGLLHPCLIRFRVNEKKCLPKFLKYIFNYTSSVIDQIMLMSNSTTIEVIYSYNLKDVLIPLPSLVEQRKIIDILDEKFKSINELIEINKNKIIELSEYKKSLIYECVTGKKEVTL